MGHAALCDGQAGVSAETRIGGFEIARDLVDEFGIACNARADGGHLRESPEGSRGGVDIGDRVVGCRWQKRGANEVERFVGYFCIR